MRKYVLLFITTLCALSTAQARFYISTNFNAIVEGSTVIPLGALTIGTYNLVGDFGVRGTALVAPTVPFVEGSIDGTYSFGDSIIFYTGAGLGYSGFADNGAVTLAGFTGLDFDANSVISLFLEVRPILYLGTGGTVQIRSGINFHIGDTPGGNGEAADCCVIP